MKERVLQFSQRTKRILERGEHFVQAVALLAVASYSYWTLDKVSMPELANKAVLVALVIIGLRGAYEIIKFLDEEK